MILEQIDDFLIGATDQAIAERMTKQIGEKVKFQHKENPPITFLGSVDDCNGADVKQFNDFIPMSSKGHIAWMSKTHGWDKESPDCPGPCKDSKTEGRQVSPLPADCLTQVHKENSFKEGTVEHNILEKKNGIPMQSCPW